MPTETFTNFRKDSDPVNRGGFGAVEIFALKVINYSEVVDPASIAAGAELSTDLTVVPSQLLLTQWLHHPGCRLHHG